MKVSRKSPGESTGPAPAAIPDADGARRLAILARLGRLATAVRSTAGACADVVGVLAEAADDLPFAAIYLVDPGGEEARLIADIRLDDDHALPRSVAIADAAPAPWPLAAVLRTPR